MRAFFALTALAFMIPQDRTAEILRRLDEVIQRQSERTRAEVLDLVRAELRRKGAPAPAGNVEAAKALVTEGLLREHVAFLADDALQGRCAGYPGNDQAAEYIAAAFKEAGLKPGGEEGGYFQKFKVGQKETRNVIAVVEGSDPALKKEVVVVGAHYDHVGTSDQRDFGRLGGGGKDKIWNGADDNASGTSVVLALARAFGEGGLAPRRTVVIIAFSGEEVGLVGSRFYTLHPLSPIGDHVYMLNLDMVGRNPNKPIELHGVGSAEGGVIRTVAEKAVAASGLKATLNDNVKLVGGDSDHSSFADKKVPYSFFFSGFHADYHMPSDHAEKLAYDHMVKVALTSIALLMGMANLDERPKYLHQASGPDLGGLLQGRPKGRRLGVHVQEIDDAACEKLGLPADQGGLEVLEIVPNSVAQASGVEQEDVILSVAGTALPRGGAKEKMLRVLTDQAKPGKEVDVVVMRGGGRVTLKATWKE